MKKTLESILVIIYVVIAIFTTICLLSYNDYKVSVFGDKTLVIIDEQNKDLKYNKGDLVIVGKEGYKDSEVGDDIFFYEKNNIKVAKILQKNDYGEAGITFTIEGNYHIVEDDVIGTSNNIKVIRKVGTILSILQSKWGFLFLIVFPSLLAFLHEVRQLLKEVFNRN